MSEPTGAPQSLRELAELLGFPADDIDKADVDGTLGLIVFERLVSPGPARFTQDEVVARSILGDDARSFWRALGFPDPQPGERIFTDADLEMLMLLEQMLQFGLIEHDVALQMTRVIGSSMARIASAIFDAAEMTFDDPGHSEATDLAVTRAATLLPTMPQVLDYTWRRHVFAAARRRLVRDPAAEGGSCEVAIGFADLVGFTALSQELSDQELAEAVGRFEATAYDVVGAGGGRIIKMIGDEVMFSVDEPKRAVEIALTLADAFHYDESLSDVRVGIAQGTVVEREGDLFGPTVNLASRIASIAVEGSVVVSSEVHDALTGDGDLSWKALRPRNLKHIGRVRLWMVRRAADDFAAESAFDRARRRREVLLERMAERLDESRLRRRSVDDDGGHPPGGEEE